MGKYTKQWEERKPKKPVRPCPFATFVSSYYSAQNGPKLTGPQLFRDASHAWNNLEEIAKQRYTDSDALKAYKESFLEYKRTKKAMKAPPHSYALFVSYYWKFKKPNYKGTRESFGRIQKQIAKEWKKLKEDEKAVHKAASNLLKALFEEEQCAVVSGNRELNLGWRDAGVKKVYPLLLSKQSVETESTEIEKMEVDKQPQRQPKPIVTLGIDNNLDETDEEFDNFD